MSIGVWLLGTRPSTLINMNVDAYLERIDYSGSREPNANTLRNLQVAHLHSVPFENLSIHAGEPIVLNDDALYRKIVEKHRGGFCYEANGAFAALLRALGFNVVMLAAGVAKGTNTVSKPTVENLRSIEFGPVFDHMALMVTLADRWLVDVGFGDSFQEPLLLDETKQQQQGNQMFCLVPDHDQRILLRKDDVDEWQPQYRFTLDSYSYTDYEDMCRFHQTSPESHFTKARICSRLTDNGRITLSDMRLITSANGEREERLLWNDDEYQQILKDQFGVVM